MSLPCDEERDTVISDRTRNLTMCRVTTQAWHASCNLRYNFAYDCPRVEINVWTYYANEFMFYNSNVLHSQCVLFTLRNEIRLIWDCIFAKNFFFFFHYRDNVGLCKCQANNTHFLTIVSFTGYVTFYAIRFARWAKFFNTWIRNVYIE